MQFKITIGVSEVDFHRERIENVMSVVIFNEIFMLMTMTIRFCKLLIAPRPREASALDEIVNVPWQQCSQLEGRELHRLLP